MQAAAQSTAQVATASNYDFRSGCKVLTQACRYSNECLSYCCGDDVCMNEQECKYPASEKYSIRPNPEIFRGCNVQKAKDTYAKQTNSTSVISPPPTVSSPMSSYPRDRRNRGGGPD